jgi:hypothetical protein
VADKCIGEVLTGLVDDQLVEERRLKESLANGIAPS